MKYLQLSRRREINAGTFTQVNIETKERNLRTEKGKARALRSPAIVIVIP